MVSVSRNSIENLDAAAHNSNTFCFNFTVNKTFHFLQFQYRKSVKDDNFRC